MRKYSNDSVIERSYELVVDRRYRLAVHVEVGESISRVLLTVACMLNE